MVEDAVQATYGTVECQNRSLASVKVVDGRPQQIVPHRGSVDRCLHVDDLFNPHVLALELTDLFCSWLLRP